MLVATFGPTNGWVGKTITYEDEVIVLDCHGPISARDVLEYDRQGHLIWPSEEMRVWARARAEYDEKVGSAVVSFGKARYMGGCSTLGGPHGGYLLVSRESIGIKNRPQLPISAIHSIDVDGGQVAKSKVLPVLAFGILGLAAKGTKDRAYVMVNTRQNETALYELDNASPLHVRAMVSPFLRAIGVLSSEELSVRRDMGAAQTPRIADEVERLAALHASGALSAEEFAALKAKLAT